MIIKSSDTNRKAVGPMVINEYKINPRFSGAVISIDGRHGKIKCIGEDRIYFILEGSGKFSISGKESEVGENDLVFVPKNTPYDISGRMKYMLICSPEFDPKHDVSLK